MDDREKKRIAAALEHDLRLTKARGATFDALISDDMDFDSASSEIAPGPSKFVNELAKHDLSKEQLQEQASLYSQYLREISKFRRGSGQVRRVRHEFRQRGLRI